MIITIIITKAGGGRKKADCDESAFGILTTKRSIQERLVEG